MNVRSIGLALSAVLFFPAIAGATPLGEATELRCAVQEAVECHPADGCRPTTTTILDLPDFIDLDLGARTMQGTTPSGRGAATQIDRISEFGALITAQGVERYAWSAMLSRATGRITLSAVDDDVGFVVFGACEPR